MTIQRMTSRMTRTAWRLLVLACVLPLLVGCEDESLIQSDANDAIFERYVALGNSITAGFQSSGINATVQQDAYPVLLAEQMNTRFEIPALEDPGCPPPLTNVLTGDRVGSGTGPGTCLFRASPIPTELNNVAVPGATIASATDASAAANELTTFILGGRTQAEVAAEIDPTFASVWLGNNDVLGAALSGNPSAMTSTADFEARYTAAADALTNAGVERGVLIGVANVAFLQQVTPSDRFPLSIPNLSAGQVIFGAEDEINARGSDSFPSWGDFNVATSCAPGSAGANTLVPFEYSVGILFSLASQGQNVTLDCTNDQTAAAVFGPETVESLGVNPDLTLLLPDEINQVAARVQAFNTFIEGVADDRGWVYIDPSETLGPLFAAGLGTPDDTSDDLVPKFPNLSLDPNPNTFGDFFSEDGVHPSSLLHRVITNRVLEAINAEYGTDLQRIEAPTIPQPE